MVAAKKKAGKVHATAALSTKKRVARRATGPEFEIKASKDGASNVLYLGHLPHGFYEKQMRGFFEQFGTVTNVRLSRSKKTAKSKGYAFLQFQSVEVAAIAAQAMDGYHMFGSKLVVKVLKKADVHPEVFNGANRVFKRIPWREIEANRHNKERTEEEEKKRAARGRRAAKKRAARITAAGIDYVFEADGAGGDAEEPKAKKAKAKTKANNKATAAAAAAKAATKAKAAPTPKPKAPPKAKQVATKATTPAVTRSRAGNQKKK